MSDSRTFAAETRLLFRVALAWHLIHRRNYPGLRASVLRATIPVHAAGPSSEEV